MVAGSSTRCGVLWLKVICCRTNSVDGARRGKSADSNIDVTLRLYTLDARLFLGCGGSCFCEIIGAADFTKVWKDGIARSIPAKDAAYDDEALREDKDDCWVKSGGRFVFVSGDMIRRWHADGRSETRWWVVVRSEINEDVVRTARKVNLYKETSLLRQWGISDSKHNRSWRHRVSTKERDTRMQRHGVSV